MDLDNKLFKEKWSQVKEQLTSTEIDKLELLVNKAHQEAEAILQGNMPAKTISYPELIMVKTLLGEGSPLKITQALKHSKSKVDSKGQIWGNKKYEQLDLEWASSAANYFKYKNNKAPFGKNAQVISIPDDVNIAIAGDWGTGYWRENDTPAKKVAVQMLGSQPDYTIHIGDTYYSGTKGEMKDNLVKIWPKGKSGTFAIPGNHEMYCGNHNYYAILPELCPLQKGASYFALQNKNWLIIALDSAYYATGDFYNVGSIGSKEGEQAVWLKDVLGRTDNRKIIIITHHQPVDLSGKVVTNLFEEVNSILIENHFDSPAFWYFGHEHNAVVYSDLSAMSFPSRCIGHGAIPYGIASDLNEVIGDAVIWTESESANDPQYPERILNGYLSLLLNDTTITETLFSENGDLRWTQSIDFKEVSLRFQNEKELS
jgi:hypothetical protein